jgi:hypothetical protein
MSSEADSPDSRILVTAIAGYGALIGDAGGALTLAIIEFRGTRCKKYRREIGAHRLAEHRRA